MSNERKEERRNFKEAMRRRIREIAASRALSDEEIKPVLSLKHQRVAEFVDKHPEESVSILRTWLHESA